MDGIAGLIEKKHRYRPKKYRYREEKEAIELVNEHPRSLKTVLAEIIEKTGIKISLKTLSIICKRAGFNWKRIKKTLFHKKNETDYQKSVDMRATLIDSSVQGFRKIYFISMNPVFIENQA
jgi:transposase